MLITQKACQLGQEQIDSVRMLYIVMSTVAAVTEVVMVERRWKQEQADVPMWRDENEGAK